MKLQEIANQMITFAQTTPFKGDVSPFQQTLPRGLTVTFLISGGQRRLSLTRKDVQPSPFEESICRQCFGVPEQHTRSEAVSGDNRIIRYEWGEQAGPFPITITWPADAPLAAIGGQWRRLEDGRIETIFYDKEELRTCIDLIQIIRERDLPREQVTMFKTTSNNYSEETR